MKKQVLILLMALTNIFSTATAQTAITRGLVAYYPFNGNANDVSGNNLNALVTRATLTTDRRGNVNTAYDFDFANASFGQQNDEIYIPYNSKLDVTNITVSVWLFPRSYFWSRNSADPNSTILNRYQYTYSTPSGGAWGISFNETSVSATIVASTNGTARANQTLQLNTWHHIVMSYDRYEVKLYIDGNLSATQSYSQSMNIVGNSGISIGESNQANGFWNQTDAKIDDLGIWNRALSNTEIQQLYTEGSISDSRIVLHNNAKSILITPDLIQTNSTVTGSSNTFFGENALKDNRDGSSNTALGFQAGSMTSGSSNIFLGANAGNHSDFQNTSNKLIISNSNTNTPLIYGEFDNELLKINGKLIIQKNNGVPTSPSSNGVQGQLAFDDEYFYICVQNNIWKRFLLNTW
jgi:hypothetical protein